jgi:hypothetical protein
MCEQSVENVFYIKKRDGFLRNIWNIYQKRDAPVQKSLSKSNRKKSQIEKLFWWRFIHDIILASVIDN